MAQTTKAMKLTIVSGSSGAGKSVALHVLEDLGYYCVDNLPMPMLPQLLENLEQNQQSIAVSLDVRNIPSERADLKKLINQLKTMGEVDIIFLDAPANVLIRRFSETRRLHPLTLQCLTLSEAVEKEKKLLQPLAQNADLRIDTGELTLYQLSDLIKERILGKVSNDLVLIFESFGFKYGLPRDADYVFDVRFLPNPHWVPELKPLTGLDLDVQQFLMKQPEVNKLCLQIENFIATWLPHLERNNRSYLTIAIGCTGGQHRSVYIAQRLAKSFAEQRHNIQIHHREIVKKEHS